MALEFLYDIGEYLQTNSVGTLGTDMHYRGFDKSAVNDIALLPTAGRGNNNAVSPDDRLYFTTMKILVKNLDGDTAESKAYQIFDLLNLVTNKVIGSTRFKRIAAVSLPWYMYMEADETYVYCLDFEIELQ